MKKQYCIQKKRGSKAKLSGQTPIQEMHSQDGRVRVLAMLRNILEQDSLIA